MQEIHYALDAQGNYQVAPGDIELAKEHGIAENFPQEQLATVAALCAEKSLQFVMLTVNLHTDVL